MTSENNFKWWLVYGATRTGSSYMNNVISLAAKTKLSDWKIGNLFDLAGPVDKNRKAPSIKFDWDRAFNSISKNILDNGAKGKGTQLDLAFKQAGNTLIVESYPSLVRMWGLPQRKIFCFRNPAGYISSAVKKFPNASLAGLQNAYVETFQMYDLIGGDVFEYSPDLTSADYINFLSPLNIADKIPPFKYTGSDSPEFTPEMQTAFENFRQKHSG